MLHYQVVRTSPGGATLSNKMNNTVHYRHVRHTLALMCAKNHLLIFSSFLDIWENVEWPRFFGPPCIFLRNCWKINSETEMMSLNVLSFQYALITDSTRPTERWHACLRAICSATAFSLFYFQWSNFSPVISGSTGPIFTKFSPYGRYLIVDYAPFSDP